MGFLAVAVVVAALLVRGSRNLDPMPPVDDPSALAFPPVVEGEGDARFPQVLPSATDDDLAPLREGPTLLVFARPVDEVGRASGGLGVELHRRLRARGVRVVLVLPREVVAGTAGDEGALRAALAAAGIASDVAVVLDDDGPGGRGRLRRGLWRVDEDNAAVLLLDGVETWRVAPPAPTVPLSRAHVAPLLHAALDSAR